MTKKWDNMTKTAWNSSEVMRELEIRLKAQSDAIRKSAGVSEEAKETKESLDSANESAKNLVSTLNQDLADDGVGEEGEQDFKDEDVKEAHETLISELKVIAQELIEQGNIKEAYKVERAIDELKES